MCADVNAEVSHEFVPLLQWSCKNFCTLLFFSHSSGEKCMFIFFLTAGLQNPMEKTAGSASSKPSFMTTPPFRTACQRARGWSSLLYTEKTVDFCRPGDTELAPQATSFWIWSLFGFSSQMFCPLTFCSKKWSFRSLALLHAAARAASMAMRWASSLAIFLVFGSPCEASLFHLLKGVHHTVPQFAFCLPLASNVWMLLPGTVPHPQCQNPISYFPTWSCHSPL